MLEVVQLGIHQKCKVKSGVKLDFIMLEPPKIFEVKSGVARTTLKERQSVSENL